MATKMSTAEQKAIDYIRRQTKSAGNCGSGWIEAPRSQEDRRYRKLYDLGLILYVGCGAEHGQGFEGGVGLIPADMFNEKMHTKIPLDWKPAGC